MLCSRDGDGVAAFLVTGGEDDVDFEAGDVAWVTRPASVRNSRGSAGVTVPSVDSSSVE